MGEGVVVTLGDVAAVENELRDHIANYGKSYAELDQVMETATGKAIQGRFADDIKAKYESKREIFETIREELSKAADYMSEQQDRLNKTINKVSDGLQ
ncbi:MAG: hypothetical protein J6X28_06110 [Bacilli bacterium]|nr:hypothetical protein [Bacilli bacterium]